MMLASRAGTRRAAAAFLLAASLLVAGCARVPAPAPAPPGVPGAADTTRPPAVPGYEAMADTLAVLDTRGLAGRRVALDPGHGGFFRGALGVGGLTESEVNLGVARRLRDLLVERGASVLLTRETDRDFLGPPDSTLRTDLAERVRLANEWAPDVFVSIHHNADAGGRHDVNETQTYYKLGDSGPSLDLAQDVHRGLVRNVGIRPHKVVPGNYFVLRNSEAPAILTETSYITHPKVEERLRQPEKQQLEAEALLVGLARYFARPIPVIEAFAAVDPAVPGEDSVFTAGEPALEARVAGAFDHAELMVDGAPVPAERAGDRVRWRPAEPWAPGPHEAVLRVRLAGVGSARERTVRFVKACVPSRVVASAWPEAPRPGGWMAVRVEVRDERGRLCPDSLPVRVRALTRAAGTIAPRETLITARDGVAWAYLRLASALDPRATRLRIRAALEGARADTLTVAARRGRDGASWTGFVREGAGATLREAAGTREPARTVRWLTRDGFAVLPRDSSGAPVMPQLGGYRAVAGTDRMPSLVAIAAGVLQGRRITLDPEGGGEEAAGVGPSGTRAANLNLEVARILAGFLERAGAFVHMTRDGDFAVTEVERVRGSESFGAERYLRIGHRQRRLGYYFSSAAGRQWAQRAAATFAGLGLRPPVWGEDAQYPLQQTSCPALYASPARVDSAGDEQALLAPGALRAEAYALFLALAREWAPAGASWPVDSLEVRTSSGEPRPGAIVTLGGTLTLETDRAGRVRFARTEPGPLEAASSDAGTRMRVVLLDSTRGAVLNGRGN